MYDSRKRAKSQRNQERTMLYFRVARSFAPWRLCVKPIAFAIILTCSTVALSQQQDASREKSPAAPAVQPAKAPSTAPAGKSTPAASDQLSVDQGRLADRFKRLEEVIGRLAELSASSDPRRAKLLREAIAQSREQDINTRFESIVKLLQDERLAVASTNQTELQKELDSLLALLLKADRDKELASQRERIRQYIKELDRLIRLQKGVRARTEGGDELRPLSEDQQRLATDTGKLNGDISKTEVDKRNASGEGPKSDEKEKPESGDKQKPKSDGKQKPNSDDKQKPRPADLQKPKPGDKQKPSENKSDQPSKSGDSSKSGEPSKPDEKSKPGKPSDSGTPQSGKPKPSDGQPSEGQPKSGNKPPSDSPPSQGQPGEQSPDENNEQQPSQPQDPAEKATNRLREAQQRMEDAHKKLKDAERKGASDEQRQALKELEQAKAELERVLRQLREEELERTLTQLAARFRKMLEMQTAVYEGTVRIDRVPPAQRTHDHEIAAARLSRQESQIVHEVDKALLLLHEDGSSVAFPEAIEQMRDDMRQVVDRLAALKVEKVTQGLEKDIIAALEETIAAFEQSLKKLEKKRTPRGAQPAAGQQDEMALVDKIAELKMIRSLQMRINKRTQRYGEMIQGEQAETPDLLKALEGLADRQQRVYRATADLQQGRND
jgi:hypothetical protein